MRLGLKETEAIPSGKGLGLVRLRRLGLVRQRRLGLLETPEAKPTWNNDTALGVFKWYTR